MVLVNEEEHSIWLGDVAIPAGWPVAREGSRPECLALVDCLALVEEMWADLRPLSWRWKMEEVRS